MEVRVQPILKFHGMDVVSVDAKLTTSFDHAAQPDIELSIVPKAFYPDDRANDFSIVLDLKVRSKGYFEIAIVCFGFFELNVPARNLEVKPFINVNAPAILFPYVRAFLAMLTSTMGEGCPKINLPPHFFTGELEEFHMQPTVVADEDVDG